MPFITTAMGVGLGLAGAGISAGASLSAAGTQADAANRAADLQASEAQQSLDFQKQEWDTQQKNQAPWVQAGQSSIQSLSDMVRNGGFPSWDQNFQAPTADQARQTPGYQFALDQGTQAVQNSAAARGDLLSGNTATALTKYGQGLADTNYQQAYNNALQQYQLGYNQFQNNQSNVFNRYATLAGLGQTSVNSLGQQGQAAANNVGNISVETGRAQGADIQNAGYQRASGYLGASNAVSSGINNVQQYLSLSNWLKNPYGNGGNGNLPLGPGFGSGQDLSSVYA